MPDLIVSRAAQADIESILAWTEEHFGEEGRLRYEALLVQALLDVGKNPDRPGSGGRPEIASDARTYHLFHSRNRVARSIGRIRRPRHFLLYRLGGDRRIEIGRVLHDSMDLPRHLPDTYRARRGDEPTE
jgi:toxin ParE1/3/4